MNVLEYSTEIKPLVDELNNIDEKKIEAIALAGLEAVGSFAKAVSITCHSDYAKKKATEFAPLITAAAKALAAFYQTPEAAQYTTQASNFFESLSKVAFVTSNPIDAIKVNKEVAVGKAAFKQAMSLLVPAKEKEFKTKEKAETDILHIVTVNLADLFGKQEA